MPVSNVRMLKQAQEPADQNTAAEQGLYAQFSGVISSRVPKISPYEIGFQLVDISEDGRDATGVGVFKIGDLWAFSPVFFRKGKIYGPDHLYIPQIDAIVPFNERWVNYLLNATAQELGVPVEKQVTTERSTHPALYSLIRPYYYGSKLADDINPKWIQKAFQVDLNVLESGWKALKLADVLKEASEATYQVFGHLLRTMPRLASVVVKNAEGVLEAIDWRRRKEAEDRWRGRKVAQFRRVIFGDRITPYPAEKIHVIFKQDVKFVPKKLASADREEILRRGFLVKDLRRDSEKNQLIWVGRLPKTADYTHFQNPNTTGIWSVFVIRDGKLSLRDFLVVTGQIRMNPTYKGHLKYVSPVGMAMITEGQHLENVRDVLLIDPADGNAFLMPLNDVYAYKLVTSDPEEIDRVLDQKGLSLRDAASRSTGTFDGGVALVDRKGRFIYIRTPLSKPIGMGDRVVYELNIGRDRFRLTVTDGTDRIKLVGNEILVPGDAQAFVVKDAFDRRSPGRPKPRLATGREITELIRDGLFDSDLVHGRMVKVYRRGDSEYVVNTGESRTRKEAFFDLMVYEGLGDKDAEKVLNAVDKEGVVYALIKEGADAYTPPRDARYSIEFPEQPIGFLAGGRIPYTQGYRFAYPIPEKTPDYADAFSKNWPFIDDVEAKPGPDRAALARAIDLAQKGNKEVFETSIIRHLLDATKDTRPVDKLLKNFFSAMKAAGQTLLAMYNSPEAFKNRYGDDDFDMLREEIKETFSGLGDLILRLKERSVGNIYDFDLLNEEEDEQ